MFSSFDNDTTNKTGIGLGLFIAKRLSEKLTFKGDSGLKVSSELGKGSTFSFIIENKTMQVKGFSIYILIHTFP